MFAAICLHRGDIGEPAALALLAHAYSPRVETLGPVLVAFDASGLERLFGGPRALVEHVAAAAVSRGWRCGVALAATRTAAALLARARDGVTVVPPGREGTWIAPLPLALLAGTAGVDTGGVSSGQADGPPPAGSHAHYRMAPAPPGPPHAGAVCPESPELGAEVRDALEMFTRWGVYTLGDLAALPPDGVHARLGRQGVAWQRLARGEDLRPLVRDLSEERFEQHLALEWPIEGLEPLSFVLARLLEPLCQHLERRDRGAVGLRLWLKLVTRTVFTRYLQVPVPIRDPKVLRTLLTLDLESHPPPAGIDEVTLACDVAPGRILQHSLLTRPLPSPDRVSTLMARLTALMGEGRCGAPSLPDTHRPGAFVLQPFVPEDAARALVPSPEGKAVCPVRIAGEGEWRHWQGHPQSLLRRFRQPIVAEVSMRADRPHRLATRHAGIRGGLVVQSAGPWRTSGCWWQPGAGTREQGPWDRDEWDVALDDRVVYCVSRDRATGTWTVEGYWD
jgi:protein ImuB